ncbi:MAG: hypothetical protein AAB263_20895 [Planctomycetota bacterium]
MVILSEDGALALASFKLVNVANGRVMMTRKLRLCDAEQFNQNWQARGIPARWEPVLVTAAAHAGE